MRVLGGIDEAGFGPLLGPLCLGLALFRLPDGEGGLRRALRGACVGGDAKIRDGDARAVVCDSKWLHRGARKLARLERTALAFLAASRGGELPATVGDVLLSGAARGEALRAHRWYRDLDARLPIAADRDEVRRVADRILGICERRGVAILELAARAVPEGELNALFEKTRIRASPYSSRSRRCWRRPRGTRRTGRGSFAIATAAAPSYAPLLSRAFDGAWVAIVRESPTESLYRVRLPEGTVRVAFAQKGRAGASPARSRRALPSMRASSRWNDSRRTSARWPRSAPHRRLLHRRAALPARSGAGARESWDRSRLDDPEPVTAARGPRFRWVQAGRADFRARLIWSAWLWAWTA